MKKLFSRYGGHGIQIGQGKSSNSKLPDDQSLENVLSNYAFQMKGFTYLSSFEMLPNFMESHKKLPHGSTKIAEINHTLSDILLQHEIFVDSKIYLVPTKYTNVFSCFISTDYKPLKTHNYGIHNQTNRGIKHNRLYKPKRYSRNSTQINRWNTIHH